MSSAAGTPSDGGGDRPWQSYHTAYTNAKAGMEGVDKEKVQKVIYEMSKGSKYFENEQKKEAITKLKIEHLRAQCAKLTDNDISHFQKVAEKKILELEASRDLSKIWLHTDMDAFYAAVETLENPSLKGKPLAVGSMSMIATASYEARKFGVRAAMPGFIGCKLCPDLVFVRPNFERYSHYSGLARKVFQRYDPNFFATSLDEAYLDITEVCIERGITGEEVASELRDAVHQETGLTCSAGVAPNRMIAKVCSDINKPNGQFILPNDRDAVTTFVSTLPIRKIGGIGKVRTRAATAQNYMSSKEDILIYAKKLLKAEMPLSLRLMGLRMSHFSGEKDDSTSPTQKTLDRFFQSSDINSNTNGTNGASCIDVSGGHNDCNDAATKDESIHDAEKDVSIDQQSSHDDNSSVPEGASSVNYDNEAASSSWKVTQTEKFDELGDLTSSRACASSSKPGQHFWADGYICSLCGFELPPCFEEERQEHSDFHLAEMLQQEEAVDNTARLSKERLAERPCSTTTTPTPKKKLKSSKEGKHIPIDSFFLKCNKKFVIELLRHTNLTGTNAVYVLQEKLQVAAAASKAAVQLQNGLSLQSSQYVVPEDVRAAGFQIDADELTSIVKSRDTERLTEHGQLDGIADKLATSLTDGISMREDLLVQREQIYGVNKFAESEPRSFWEFVWDALQDTTLIILAACAFVSLTVGIATEGWPNGSHDGIGIFASIILVVSVTATSDYQQSLQFRDLDKEKRKILVQVTRDGFRQRILIDDLLPGDVVHLAVGDQVPADGVFVSGFSLLLDESSLTGESEPVDVNEDKPFLSSGTKVLDGSGQMLVTSVGMRTQWGKLMAALTEGGNDETPLQVKLSGVANIIGKIGLFFAVLTFVVLSQELIGQKYHDGLLLSWSGDDVLEILNHFAVAVTIVVVAVPEGLPLAVTLSLAYAMEKMMNDKALVRQLAACETMGSATVICSDKTGTLTSNRMTVVKACICGNTVEVSDPLIPSSLSSELPEVAVETLLESILTNTGGEVVVDQNGKQDIIGTPTETALLEFALSLGGNYKQKRQETKIVKVEPFNSVKKRMTVILELPGGGYRAHCKGATEIVLAACDKFIDGSGSVVPLDKKTANMLNDIIETFSSEALRTLCLAYRGLEDGSTQEEIPLQGYTFIGIVGIKDPVRPGVRESVASCRSAGIAVKMVTGDNINTAKAIARECGILTDGGLAIEGAEFREKTPKELLELIPKMQVLARSSPLDKLALVKHLRTTSNEVVAVTGDGTNDAPALREADIGLAMGVAGTEVAKESADVVILDDNFSTIVTVAKWGRSVYVNIQKFVQFQLTVNIVALLVNFSSACFTGDAPLTAVQLLWVNMIMDTLGALALATEPPNDNLMEKAPVGRTGKFITNIMWRNILGQSLYQFTVLWYLQSQGRYVFGLEGSEADTVLNTIIFNTFVFCQVFNEVTSREMEEINVLKGMSENSIFVGVLTGTVVFQFILVQFLGDFANTTPLTQLQWLICILFGFLGMPIAAMIKLISVEPREEQDGYGKL
ncbi:Calcium-transporting ATPase 2, plasma membrane-type [Triticum urartu]|uniref:Calcium-transporting ATPase n=1 Tax=Triticum urartu TaxID=4572 RepID=M8AJX4_TRIUA|nr:Calcium-transporting ATPase 2, plasma membrane-type [Triticum urartu]